MKQISEIIMLQNNFVNYFQQFSNFIIFGISEYFWSTFTVQRIIVNIIAQHFQFLKNSSYFDIIPNTIIAGQIMLSDLIIFVGVILVFLLKLFTCSTLFFVVFQITFFCTSHDLQRHSPLNIGTFHIIYWYIPYFFFLIPHDR